MPKDWTSLIKRATKSDRALKKLTQLIAKKDALYRATVSTTRAVDLVSGGVKVSSSFAPCLDEALIGFRSQVNALPELSMAVANHRINADSSVAELQEQLISVITPLAKKLDLSFEAFNQSILSTDSHKGLIRMSQAFDSALEPAPISPHDISSPAWNLLSGSVKATYSSRKNPGDDTDIKMMPGLAIG
jgi:Gly-Xaa carboxypeptidase